MEDQNVILIKYASRSGPKIKCFLKVKDHLSIEISKCYI